CGEESYVVDLVGGRRRQNGHLLASPRAEESYVVDLVGGRRRQNGHLLPFPRGEEGYVVILVVGRRWKNRHLWGPSRGRGNSNSARAGASKSCAVTHQRQRGESRPIASDQGRMMDSQEGTTRLLLPGRKIRRTGDRHYVAAGPHALTRDRSASPTMKKLPMARMPAR